MNPVDSRWLVVASGAAALRQGATESWLEQGFFGLRMPVWLAMLATLCAIGLLLALHQVVLQGVRKSELRQQVMVKYADGVWRCNALRGLQRTSCHAQLNATHALETQAYDRVGEASMTLARISQ